MSLIIEYFNLTKKYIEMYGEKTILLMQVGAFYEVYGKKNYNIENENVYDNEEIYGSDIKNFSNVCDLNIVEKGNCGTSTEKIVMAGFKDIMIDKYIKKLQSVGYTIVVYNQEIQGKTITRNLCGIFSPGTYFQTEKSQLTNNTTCIWIDIIENKLNILKSSNKSIVIGISNIDIYTGKTSIFQFKETWINNPSTYDELERFISIYNPCECIIISNLSENIIEDIISYSKITSKLIHKVDLNLIENTNTLMALKCEKQNYQKELIERFYTEHNYSTFIDNFNDNVIATQSFCYLLDFIYRHNPFLVNKLKEPLFENYSNRLLLANHSLKQLNIIDDNTFSGKYSSILKLLNTCITSMGKRIFEYQLLNPTIDTEYLQKEYDIIEHMINNNDKYKDNIYYNLLNIKDITKWNRQILLKKISPKYFFNLHENLSSLINIYNCIKNDDVIMKYLNYKINDLNNFKSYCVEIQLFITSNLDLIKCKNITETKDFDELFILKNVSSELDNKTEIYMDSYDKLNSINTYFNTLINNTETSKNSKSLKTTKTLKTTEYVKIYETEKNNYSLISTKRRCVILKDALNDENIELSYISTYSNQTKKFILNCNKKNIEIHAQTASNNSISCTDIYELCKNISIKKIEMKELIMSIYHELLEKFQVYEKKINVIVEFITYIDLVYTKVNHAIKYNYCKPEIVNNVNKSFVNIKSLRHCLIEQLHQSELYISNDLCLGDYNSDGILLYGTNAVGKTSFIRAIGISVIMAQAGLYVPAVSFIYKPYKSIFTRIIGNDNIFKGLSTFAVEMSELRTILRLSDENSLILGDELCSGTESISAISIFVAGIETLYEKKCSFIFSTHLHEITKYKEIVDLTSVSLKHMKVIYDKEKDILIYDRKIHDGSGTNTYGLEVCKSLQLPYEFLEKAHNIRMKYNPEMKNVLSLKTSHYNSNKIMSLCEKCKKSIGTEVHHISHQSTANKHGIITRDDNSTFHKNHLANLMTLCEDCHKDTHKREKKDNESVKGIKKVKKVKKVKQNVEIKE